MNVTALNSMLRDLAAICASAVTKDDAREGLIKIFPSDGAAYEILTLMDEYQTLPERTAVKV